MAVKMNAIESHPAITRYVETIKQREGLKQKYYGATAVNLIFLKVIQKGGFLFSNKDFNW